MNINIITISLLMSVLVLEALYILFREPRLNSFNKYIITASLLSLIYTTIIDPSFYEIVRLVSILVVLTANVKLKHPDYEKPDYRYLLILLGAIFLNIFLK